MNEPRIAAAVVASRAGLKTSSLARLHRRGLGPQGRIACGTRSTYPLDAAERWLAERLSSAPRPSSVPRRSEGAGTSS